ncbi:MAG: hypothetical protein JWN99_1716, partial [Ilumatobacteraceae bacterium]|nr:hypothetical protein [Ilumatobacteraceae bacterium]
MSLPTRRSAIAHVAAAACFAALITVPSVVTVPSVSASLDPTFGNGTVPGVVHVSEPSEQLIGRAVGALSDGSIIAAANGRVFKYTAGGALDPSFGPISSPGSVTLQAFDPVSVSIDGNGMIVIAGSRLDTGIGQGDPELIRMSPAG